MKTKEMNPTYTEMIKDINKFAENGGERDYII